MSDVTVPEGNHTARVQGHALTEQKDGQERYVVEFAIVGGDFSGEYVRARYGFKSDAQTDLTISQLRALGWKGTDFTNVNLDTEKDFSIKVKHTVGEDGKLYVDALVNTASVERFALAPDKARAFAARMKAKVAAYDAQNGAPAGTATPPRTAAPTQTRQAAPATRTASPAPNGRLVGSQRNPAPAGAPEWDGTGREPGDDGFDF